MILHIEESFLFNKENTMKAKANYLSFDELDIRVGRVVKVEDTETEKPTYRLIVDFGAGIDNKVSCGAFRNYKPEELIGRQVIGIINLPPKQMGKELSEVLILGVKNKKGETIFLTPQTDVMPGESVF